MKSDTRPDQHTRHFDVPVDPIERKRSCLKADRLDLTAIDFRREEQIVVADLLTGIAMALREEDPITDSPVVRTAHTWVSRERAILSEVEWAAELVSKAAGAMNCREISTADFLRGVAAGLGGMTVASDTASATFRMGIKAVIECQRGRPQYTEIVIAAPSDREFATPERSETTDPIEHEATRPHSVPASFDEEQTHQHVDADPVPPPLLEPPSSRVRKAIEREIDAPFRRGGGGGDEDLTRARLVPRTEILKTPVKP